MPLECTNCQTPIPAESVDDARQIATCAACGRIVDLQQQMSQAGSKPRLRDPVELPAGMQMRRWWDGPSEGPGSIEITRRWLRSKHFKLLAGVLCLAFGIAFLWTSGFEPAELVIVAGVFVTIFGLRLIPMFVNSTSIRIEGDELTVRHGPVPTLLFRNQTVKVSDLKQLFAVKLGALYEVDAQLEDGSKLTLIRPLVSEQQALFVEQSLENHLGIVDFEVVGELEAARSGKPAPVPSGVGGAMALMPVLIIAGVFLFFSAMSSSVEGSFALGEEFGGTTFVPDHCESGETLGFFGVQLTSEAAPGTVMRAIQDPTRGSLLVVERGGARPVSVTPEECEALQVSVHRTDTNVNTVWVVKGSASANCPGLSGAVKFDGCH